MAPFNKRQIGYIQAVAGRQQHTTLVCGTVDGQISSKDLTNPSNNLPYQARNVRKAIGHGLTSSDVDAKSLLIKHYYLDSPERCHDSRGSHNDAVLDTTDITGNGVNIGSGGTGHVLNVFMAKCAENTYSGSAPISEVTGTVANVPTADRVPSESRATPDGYLKSTDVRFRFTLPTIIPQVSWDMVKDSFDHDIRLLFEGSVGSSGAIQDVSNTSANLEWWQKAFDLYQQGKFDINDSTLTSIAGATLAGLSELDRGRFTDDARKHFREAVSAVRENKPMGQDHYEFRWIVWRNKRPTVPWTATYAQGSGTNLESIRDGASFRNPGYDLFVGQSGRKRGLIGYTGHPKLDSDNPYNLLNPTAEYYSGEYWNGAAWVEGGDNADGRGARLHPIGEASFTPDDLMTVRLNRDDYVIMKDVRFFLGKEHGKSHFEDTLHWDWNDPIDTNQENVLTSTTLNSKNFRWHMTLIGTSNGKSPVILNHHVRWTTKMESG
jgi:hypothetical protein